MELNDPCVSLPFCDYHLLKMSSWTPGTAGSPGHVQEGLLCFSLLCASFYCKNKDCMAPHGEFCNLLEGFWLLQV